MDLGIPGLEAAEPVGQGGFATVYKAQQPAFARTVAVKVLSGTSFDEDSRLRFERELRALGLLSEHPGIVTVHDTGFTTDRRPYLTMAFVDDGTLADRLSKSGPVPWPEAVVILIRLAGALETAHRSGIVHRDIKPANVLMSRYGAQLSDFGIARIAGAHETHEGIVTASVAYAAPEVLDGARPTVSADIYSLGSTAYAMRLGTSPFARSADESFISILRRIHSDPPPDLREHGVPADLATLLAQMLAKDPADRPASAVDVAHRLQAVMRAHGRPAPELILASELVAQVGGAAHTTEVMPDDLSVAGRDTNVMESGTRSDSTPLITEPLTRSRRPFAALLVGGALAIAAVTGIAFAVRNSSGETVATPVSPVEDDQTPTVSEPTASEPTPTTSDLTETVSATPTNLPSPSTAPSAVDAPADTTTLAPISDEPVCGTGDELVPKGEAPVRVILDSGVGAGIDDVGALAMLHSHADAGEAEILAIMVSVAGDADAARSVDAVNTYYGRPDIPVGVVAGPGPSGSSAYTAQIAADFPNDLVEPESAVDLYRRVLDAAPDASVTIISGGFLTNLAGLLASPADEVSDLTGEELVAAKVRLWVAMGGAYPESSLHIDDQPEFNFSQDASAVQRSVTGWPVPAVFSGFEVGRDILAGAALQTDTPPDNPVREAYRLSGATDNGPSFDLTAVLVGVRGTSGREFELCSGRNLVAGDGTTTWQHREGDLQAYLRTVASSEEIAASIDELLTSPPAG